MSSQMHLLEESDKQEGAIFYFSFPFVWEFWNWVCIHFHFCENFQTCLENAFSHETQEKEPHWKHLKMHFFVGTEKLIQIHIFSSQYFILKFWVSRKFHSAGGGIIQREIPLWFLYQQAPWNWFGLSSCFT